MITITTLSVRRITNVFGFQILNIFMSRKLSTMNTEPRCLSLKTVPTQRCPMTMMRLESGRFIPAVLILS